MLDASRTTNEKFINFFMTEYKRLQGHDESHRQQNLDYVRKLKKKYSDKKRDCQPYKVTSIQTPPATTYIPTSILKLPTATTTSYTSAPIDSPSSEGLDYVASPIVSAVPTSETFKPKQTHITETLEFIGEPINRFVRRKARGETLRSTTATATSARSATARSTTSTSVRSATVRPTTSTSTRSATTTSATAVPIRTPRHHYLIP
ncbi:hypothetical protein ACF0H5_017819 [Mactra antiquata]